jgi:hypothetical protein
MPTARGTTTVRKGLLSALRAHAKTQHENNILWETLWPRNSRRAARTEGAVEEQCAWHREQDLEHAEAREEEGLRVQEDRAHHEEDAA